MAIVSISNDPAHAQIGFRLFVFSHKTTYTLDARGLSSVISGLGHRYCDLRNIVCLRPTSADLRLISHKAGLDKPAAPRVDYVLNATD